MFEKVPASTFPFLRQISRKRSAYKCGAYTPGREVLIGWQDGSRDQFAFAMTNGKVVPVQFNEATLDPNRMGDPYRQRHMLTVPPEGAIALVQYGTFLGKDATPSVYPIGNILA